MRTALHSFARQCACIRVVNCSPIFIYLFSPLIPCYFSPDSGAEAAVASRVNTHSGNTGINVGMGTDLSINAAKSLCCCSKLKYSCRDPAGRWSWHMHRKLCTALKDEGIRFNARSSSHCTGSTTVYVECPHGAEVAGDCATMPHQNKALLSMPSNVKNSASSPTVIGIAHKTMLQCYSFISTITFHVSVQASLVQVWLIASHIIQHQ